MRRRCNKLTLIKPLNHYSLMNTQSYISKKKWEENSSKKRRKSTTALTKRLPHAVSASPQSWFLGQQEPFPPASKARAHHRAGNEGEDRLSSPFLLFPAISRRANASLQQVQHGGSSRAAMFRVENLHKAPGPAFLSTTSAGAAGRGSH